jgi:hypothetical protein
LFRDLGLRSFDSFNEWAHEVSLLLKSQLARKTGPEFRTFFSEGDLIEKTAYKPRSDPEPHPCG